MSLGADDADPTLDVELGGQGGDSSVIDDAKYSHRRRLQAIHNAHDRVLEVRNAVEDRRITGAINEHQARRYYRGAVETFIMEVLPVLRSDEIQLSEDYAEDIDLGQVTLRPPHDLVQYARANIDRMPPGASVPQPVAQSVQGLESILTLPSPMRHTFAVSIRDGRDIKMVRRTVEEEIPRDILDRAIQKTMQALEEADMGLNVGEGRPHNSLGAGDSWAFEKDDVLPHEVHDALRRQDLSKSDLLELIEDEEEEDGDAE